MDQKVMERMTKFIIFLALSRYQLDLDQQSSALKHTYKLGKISTRCGFASGLDVIHKSRK